jgi:hypothetical protein
LRRGRGVREIEERKECEIEERKGCERDRGEEGV